MLCERVVSIIAADEVAVRPELNDSDCLPARDKLGKTVLKPNSNFVVVEIAVGKVVAGMGFGSAVAEVTVGNVVLKLESKDPNSRVVEVVVGKVVVERDSSLAFEKVAARTVVLKLEANDFDSVVIIGLDSCSDVVKIVAGYVAPKPEPDNSDSFVNVGKVCGSFV